MNHAETDNNNCGRSFAIFVAVAGALMIFAALVWTTKKYTTPAPLGAARAAERSKALADLRAANAEALENVGWVDQSKGVVRLPIAEAMRLTEQAWQNPAKARADLIAREEKASAPPPKVPEKPSQYE
ncbi:MAG: hypothetical protein EPO07_20445 [Verrucomicrobia bacterium]|nr:MAG: hypothetical protein EPO07_20445 [Verrucomicrobiota bacterium]